VDFRIDSAALIHVMPNIPFMSFEGQGKELNREGFKIFNREGAKDAKMPLAKVFKVSRKGAKCAKNS